MTADGVLTRQWGKRSFDTVPTAETPSTHVRVNTDVRDALREVYPDHSISETIELLAAGNRVNTEVDVTAGRRESTLIRVTEDAYRALRRVANETHADSLGEAAAMLAADAF